MSTNCLFESLPQHGLYVRRALAARSPANACQERMGRNEFMRWRQKKNFPLKRVNRSSSRQNRMFSAKITCFTIFGNVLEIDIDPLAGMTYSAPTRDANGSRQLPLTRSKRTI